MGPSHHAYIDGCCLSKCETYETPFGDMTLDRQGRIIKRYLTCQVSNKWHIVLDELYETGKFEWMSKSVDEQEHSIEMHLPFTFKIFQE